MKVSKILALGLGAVAAGIIVAFVILKIWGAGPAARPAALENRILHYYDAPQLPLGLLRFDVVYFVPSDQKDLMEDAWQQSLETAAGAIKNFYELQFEGLASVEVHIYPHPVIGLKESAFYNGQNTDHGNPNALLVIRRELDQRISNSAGDLYRQAFAEPGDRYRVFGIVYEGVGSVGSGVKRTALIAREFLTRPVLKDAYGLTFFAHEFGHALGMPDLTEEKNAGDTNSGQRFTNDDIMGSGRYKPLALTHLSDEIKKHMIGTTPYAQN